MASPSTETPRPLRLRDVIDHDDEDDGDVTADEEEVEEEDDEEEDWDMSRRMSRLFMEGSDGGDADDEDDGYRRGVAGEAEEEEEDEDDEFEVRSDVNGATYGGAHRAWPPYDVQAAAVPSSASLPGTPDRSGAQAAQSPWWPGPSSASKEYASETEVRYSGGGGGAGKRRQRHRRQERMMREVWLERAWRMRKQRRQLLDQGALDAVPLVVLGGGSGESPGAAARAGVAMDMEEMRACRDLGLDLPCDWTVEIPCYVDTASSGGNSPASGSWRISSPGDDPNDVKARLKGRVRQPNARLRCRCTVAWGPAFRLTLRTVPRPAPAPPRCSERCRTRRRSGRRRWLWRPPLALALDERWAHVGAEQQRIQKRQATLQAGCCFIFLRTLRSLLIY